MRPFLVLAVLALGTAAYAQSEEEQAGDVSEVEKADRGPLKEKIAPVSGHLFLKRGRFEVSPSVATSLKDAFFTKYVFGGSLMYHPAETWGLGLHLGYSMPVVAGAAQICTIDNSNGTSRGCRQPTMAELNGRAPGQITLLSGLDIQWAPIYGKIALLAEGFIHFDLYAIAGPELVQYQGPTASGIARNLTVGGDIGLGMRFFLNRWVALRAELKDLMYVENVQPLPATSLRNELFFQLGLSLFFPTTTTESER